MLDNVDFVCAGMLSVCVASVIHSDVAEQIGHGLSVVDAPNRLGQDHTDIHSFDFWTLQLLHLVRYSVGHHHLEAQYNSLSDFVSAHMTIETLLP